uniref:Uncharacterized protein n=1 Tax=Rhizophora mucronata TaxID=61149 RepID=A0A2P2JIC3_RHIMU
MTIMDSDLSSACVSSEDASLIIGSSDASRELKNTVPLEGTTWAGFESPDKLSESATSSKCFIAPDIRESNGHNGAESCKESNVDDAYTLNPYESASGELKIAVLIEETKSADSLLNQKATKQSSKATKSADSDHMENEPVLNFTVQNNGHTCLNYYIGEDHKRHNVECIQANSSTEKPAVENPANQINEILYESKTGFSVADQDSGSNELKVKQ